jgi:hypothetical protein
MVRRNDSPVSVPVPVDVLVVGDLFLEERFGMIKSSHRRSCKPFRRGSLPLDLRDREKDRPGDLRTPLPPSASGSGTGGMDVGGLVRRGRGALGGEG